jgi:predicted nucleic acid-binding protein
MHEVLLDTDVFSILLRENDMRASLYRPHVQGRIAVVSYVTIGELYFWGERRKWGDKRLRLLEEAIRATTVVRYDLEVCKTYAHLKPSLKNPSGSQRTIGDNDLWIASCAVRHDITLVTHNRRHFEGIPHLRIISEAP